jgi:hypothetical protein
MDDRKPSRRHNMLHLLFREGSIWDNSHLKVTTSLHRPDSTLGQRLHLGFPIFSGGLKDWLTEGRLISRASQNGSQKQKVGEK